jgi:fatty acid desaturase
MRLRYRADWRTLAILCVYAAATAAAWQLAPTGIWLFATLGFLCVNSWLCAVIAHNVVHSPVFDARWANQILQIWISLSYGFPISDYIPGHNLSHHRFTQMREDVMRTTKVNYRWHLLNLLLFFPAVTPAILRGNTEYKKLRGARAKRWQRQLLIETIVVWSVKIGLLALDWRKALLFIFIPHLYANFGIVTINFLWHDGCDMDHPTNHSRNVVGPIMNFFTLNNGFHGIHHMDPGLHWSLAPKAHAERVHPTIHPALEQRSVVVYLFKTFIYPGKRLTYDGKPLIIKDEGPDRSWVRPEESETSEGEPTHQWSSVAAS